MKSNIDPEPPFHWHEGDEEFVDYGVAGGGWTSTQWRCYLPCCESGHVWTDPVRVGVFRRRNVQRCAYRNFYPYSHSGICYAEREV
jgi:hypothetical protein